MRLLITTPTSVVVDADDVRHVRAEDDTGAFGIQPGHADLVTVLAVSVLSWRDRAAVEHHVAVRGGVLTVREGRLVEVASRGATGEDTLARLVPAVLDRFRAEVESEQASHSAVSKLHLAAIRSLERYLRGDRRPLPPGFSDEAGPGNGS